MGSQGLAGNKNQVPPGYKQTEVGVIPEDWEVKYLKQISPSQSVGLVINPSSYFDERGTVPILVGSQIYENYINWETANRITETSNESLPASRLKAGDLVTVRVGEPGITAVVPPELDGCNCASMMIVRQHPSFNSLWLCYMMNSRLGKNQINHVQYGTAQKQFNISDAIDFIYPVPPLPEQKTIASVLSDVDELISALDKLIAKKRHIKTATMQQLLTGKTRLPGFGEGMGYKKSAIGLIPEDWEVRGIETLGTGTIPPIKAGPFGSSLTKDTYVKNGYKVYGQEQVIRGNHLYGDYFISEQKFRELESCIVKPGDILLSLVGTAGKLLIIPENAPIGIINPRLLRLSFDNSIVNNIFFKSLFESNKMQNFFTRYAQGGTMGVLNAGMLRSVVIAIPPIKEQKAIASVLSDIDQEIAALEKRRAKTQAIKQGMMQELLTGKTRIIDN